MQAPDLSIGGVQRGLETRTGGWVLLCASLRTFLNFYVIRAILGTNFEPVLLNLAFLCSAVSWASPWSPRPSQGWGFPKSSPGSAGLRPGAGPVQYQQWPLGGSARPGLRAAAASPNPHIPQIHLGEPKASSFLLGTGGKRLVFINM